jgi:Ca2+-binding EF-hand superfamily protein
LRAWRRELDPDGSLDIDFLEFCQASARLGIAVDATKLFTPDSPGSFTLDQLSPESGWLVNLFRAWMTRTFGGPGDMFMAFESPDPSDVAEGRVFRQEFITGCAKHQLELADEEICEIWNLLDAADVGSIEMPDVMFLETDVKRRAGAIHKAKMKGKEQREKQMTQVYNDTKLRTEMPGSHRLAPRAWDAPMLNRLPEVILENRLRRQKQKYQQRARARAIFYKHLVAKYGNTMRAWRKALGTNGRFAISRQELGRYCRCQNLKIDLSSLWTSMDSDGDGTLEMHEIAPQHVSSLAHFLDWARGTFGSCVIWPEIMAAARPSPRWKSTSSLPSTTFIDALVALQWPMFDPGEGPALCSALDLNGCGMVSHFDLEWLDGWDPPVWLSARPDLHEWKCAKAKMLQFYTLPLRAWRRLDADDSNLVSWSEFQDVCDAVKFDGNRGGAWRAVNKNNSGTITLREFDETSFVVLKSFKEWADTHFGSVELAFKSIDTDGSGALSFAELRRACKKTKWDGDVRFIFDCLDIDTVPGQRSLSYEEVMFLDSWEPSLDDLDNSINDDVPFCDSTRRGTTVMLPRVDETVSLASSQKPLRSVSCPSLKQSRSMSTNLMQLPCMQRRSTSQETIASSLRLTTEQLRAEIDDEYLSRCYEKHVEMRKQSGSFRKPWLKRRRPHPALLPRRSEEAFHAFPPLSFHPNWKPRSPALMDSPIPGVSATHHGVFCRIPESEELSSDDFYF